MWVHSRHYSPAVVIKLIPLSIDRMMLISLSRQMFPIESPTTRTLSPVLPAAVWHSSFVSTHECGQHGDECRCDANFKNSASSRIYLSRLPIRLVCTLGNFRFIGQLSDFDSVHA